MQPEDPQHARRSNVRREFLLALAVTVIGGLLVIIIAGLWKLITKPSVAPTIALPVPSASSSITTAHSSTTPPSPPDTTSTSAISSPPTSEPVASSTPPPQPPTPPSSYKVPLGTICDTLASDVYICGTDFGGKVQVNGRLYPYVGQNNGFASAMPPNWGSGRVVSVGGSTCSRVVFSFAEQDRPGGGPSIAYVRLSTTSADPVVVQANRGTVGTLDAPVGGDGAFEVDATSSTGAQVFMNGYAVCSSQFGNS